MLPVDLKKSIYDGFLLKQMLADYFSPTGSKFVLV